MGWFLTALAPVLQIVPFHELAADHILYVPLIGVCLVGGLTVDYVSRERGYRELALGVLALVLVVFSVRTVGRNRDWADVETLWRATLEQAPGSYRAHSNLAVTYMGKQEPEAALKHTLRALELNPGRALEWSNLSALYVQLAERARAQRKIRPGVESAGQVPRGGGRSPGERRLELHEPGQHGELLREGGRGRRRHGRDGRSRAAAADRVELLPEVSQVPEPRTLRPHGLAVDRRHLPGPGPRGPQSAGRSLQQGGVPTIAGVREAGQRALRTGDRPFQEIRGGLSPAAARDSSTWGSATFT